VTWILVDIGCIECGSDTHIVGVFDDKQRAGTIAEKLSKTMDFHDGGQHHFEVFDMPELNEIAEIFRDKAA
jgi:hypothetical protein